MYGVPGWTSLGARNRLSGTVQRVETGWLMAEVVVELDGDETVTATVTSGPADRLGLEARKAVDAVIEASEVTIETDRASSSVAATDRRVARGPSVSTDRATLERAMERSESNTRHEIGARSTVDGRGSW